MIISITERITFMDQISKRETGCQVRLPFGCQPPFRCAKFGCRQAWPDSPMVLISLRFSAQRRAFSGAEKLFSAVGSRNALSLGAVRGEPLAGRSEALRGADVVPLAVMDDRGEATRLFGPIEEADQREDRSRCLVEQPPVQQLNAGEEVGCNLALAAAARVSLVIEKVIAAPGIADRGRRRLQQQHSIRGCGLKGGGEPEQGRGLVVEPEHVAVDGKERLAERR